MKYDVFISYSHVDNEKLYDQQYGWIDWFCKALTINLKGNLGRKPNIFRDNTSIEGYQKIPDEVSSAIADSLLFIPILSPSFLTSDYCPQEVEQFFNHRMDPPNDKFKIVPVVRRQDDERPLPKQITDIKRKYCFYEHAGPEEQIFYLDPEQGRESRQKFLEKIEQLAYDLAKYIKKFDPNAGNEVSSPPDASSTPCIYLAEPTPDLWDDYENIARDLRQRGRLFLPAELDKDAPRIKPVAEFVQKVKKDMDRCNVSVSLIGAKTNGYPKGSDFTYHELQMKIAAERNLDPNFKRLVWLPPHIDIDKIEELNLIQEISKSGSTNVQFIRSSIEEFKGIVRDVRISPPPQATSSIPSPAAPSDKKPVCVFVICDQSDLEWSHEIEDALRAKFHVVPAREYLEPALKGSSNINVFYKHQEQLKVCDAVVIYWNKAPRTWVNSNISELQRIMPSRESRNFLAKAVFCDGETDSEYKSWFKPPTSDLMKVSNYSELDLNFVSQLEGPLQ